nr:GPI mannosyltransferase 2-like isoform X2 [Cherax quadricarinatus]
MRTYTLGQKVKNFAIASRVIVLALQAVSNLLIPDHQADAFISPEDPSVPVSWPDQLVKILLGGLVRWDAQYFLHIAQYGYTHENTLAFFPLFPLTVRFITVILNVPLQFIFNYYSVLLISAVLINFYLFIKTAVVFHKLSEEVLRNQVLAYRAALLFCVNPASVFFTAPYSEGLFAFLTFSALLMNETRSTSTAAMVFGLASSARSNGLVNVGFILYRKLQDCSNYFYKIRNATTESGQLSLLLVLVLTFNYTLIPLFIGCFLVILPFALFQMWCYNMYCGEEGSSPSLAPHLEMFVRSNFLHSPDLGEAEWCYNFPPLAYSHVQDKYWEVCWALGIPQSVTEQRSSKQSYFWPEEGINSWRIFIYTAHSLCLCAFCVLCIHVQVTTRLLCSSCPVVYWFAAHLISDQPKNSAEENSRENEDDLAECLSNMTKRYQVSLLSELPRPFWGQVILSYFILYFLIGIILYSNFLPWT